VRLQRQNIYKDTPNPLNPWFWKIIELPVHPDGLEKS